MEIYKQYAELIAQSKIIDLQIEEAKQQIITDMKNSNANNIKHDFGTFTMATRKKLSYSDNIKQLEESVKLAKIEEEEKGIATTEITEYFSFRG